MIYRGFIPQLLQDGYSAVKFRWKVRRIGFGNRVRQPKPWGKSMI